MKFCPDCGTKRVDNFQHCSCGFQFYSKPKTSHNAARFSPNEISVKTFHEGLAKKKKNNLFMALAISGGGLAICITVAHGATIFVIFIAVFLLVWAAGTTLNSCEYHALPDALDQHGEHQCLFCDGRSIYKSTVYKTSITECRCSRCKQNLFNE